MNTVKSINWQTINIRHFAVAISLLISIVTLAFGINPNDDAFTYIRNAELFLEEGTAAAFAHYQWATYPITMAMLHSLLGVELVNAAYIINALFYALLTYSFISIVREIDDSRRVQLLAAITVLVYPQLSEYRLDIVRDVGFWSLSIFALWQFLEFGKHFANKHAIAFCVAMLLATLLRIEAIAYMLLIPLALVLDQRLSNQRRLRLAIFYSSVSLGFLLLVFLVLLVLGLNLLSLLADFVSVYGVFVKDSFLPDEATSAEFARVVFGEHAENYSNKYIPQFLLGGLISLLLVNLFNGIGGPYLIILTTGFVLRMLAIPRSVFLPASIIFLVNLLILFTFVLFTRYLSSRYGMLGCIMLALLIPVILHRLLLWAESIGRLKLVSRGMVVFLLYCAFDAYLSFGVNQGFSADTAAWINTNKLEHTVLLTNNRHVAYYTGLIEDYDKVTRHISAEQIIQLPSGSLLAIELDYTMEELLVSAEIASRVELLRTFMDRKGPRLVLYLRNTL
jgi:hypothetical protein